MVKLLQQVVFICLLGFATIIDFAFQKERGAHYATKYSSWLVKLQPENVKKKKNRTSKPPHAALYRGNRTKAVGTK